MGRVYLSLAVGESRRSPAHPGTTTLNITAYVHPTASRPQMISNVPEVQVINYFYSIPFLGEFFILYFYHLFDFTYPILSSMLSTIEKLVIMS